LPGNSSSTDTCKGRQRFRISVRNRQIGKTAPFLPETSQTAHQCWARRHWQATRRSFRRLPQVLGIHRPDLPRQVYFPRKLRGFTSGLHVQVNTLDETSRIQVNVGTNYTIGPRASELPRQEQRFPQHEIGGFLDLLKPVFFHEMAEGAVGNPKHVGGFRLHTATLAQGTLQ
jgi:hypothetical protein